MLPRPLTASGIPAGPYPAYCEALTELESFSFQIKHKARH